MENRCVCCGEIIFENGRLVCIDCEIERTTINKMANDLKSILKTNNYNYEYIASILFEKGWQKK